MSDRQIYIPPSVERSIEQRDRTQSLLSPSGWITDYFEGGASKSGEVVTEDRALKHTTIYACIKLLAETVAQLPIKLYRKDADGEQVEQIVDHPVADLLDEPNRFQSTFELFELLMAHAAGWGNGYLHTERNVLGEVIAIVPMHPSRIEPVVDGREVVYLYQADDGGRAKIPARNVIHIRALGTDILKGISPIRAHAEAIGAAIAAVKFGGGFFGGNATLGGVLEVPDTLNDEARMRLRRSWEALKGQGYAGTAVLEEGLKYTPIGIPPEESQFVQTRQLSRSELAAIWSIPPHMIGDLGNTAYNNIAEQSLHFMRHTMTPWVRKIEERLDRVLLSTEERRGGFYIKMRMQALLRGTPKDRFDTYRTAITTGWMSRNEARVMEDMNPIDGLDEVLVPLNMIGNDALESVQSDEEEQSQRVDLRPLMDATARRMAKYLTVHVRKAFHRGGLEGVMEWVDDPATRSNLARELDPFEQAMGTRGLIDRFDASRIIQSVDMDEGTLDRVHADIVDWFEEQ